MVFSYIRRLEPFFFFFLGGGGGWGVKIKNFNIYEVFRKNEFFGGYEDFVDILNLDYNYGSFLCILGSFLKWRKFWGFAKIQYIFEVLESFGVNV